MQHAPLPYSDFAAAFPAPVPAPAVFPVADFATCDATLLSSAESTSFFGFLDKFEWDFDPSIPHGLPVFSPPSSAASDCTGPSAGSVYSHSPRGTPVHALDEQSYHQQQQHQHQHQHQHQQPHSHQHPHTHSLRSSASTSASSASPPPSASTPHASPPHHNHTARTKPLLSTPQKRLNHIMSEQKRRNAIRDGYATLTNMLAPAGAPVGSGIPTRGRPKGSGARGKNGSEGAKGKSGVLFRAVEYCKWLDEGCEALRHEVDRVEIAAGIGAEVY